jgi:DNA-binding transcriptional ArsR family regulator
VRHLAHEGECHCGHFELGISKATLSHHFRVLRESGVVHSRPDGRKRYLTLRTDDLEVRFPGLIDAVLNSDAVASQNGRAAQVVVPDPTVEKPLRHEIASAG